MTSATRGRTLPGTSFTVLIVDDDSDARHIYADYLHAKGWTTTTAPDGRKALEKANELKPDVVVLDLAMPRVDGWTVLKHLRESSWTATIPVIVVSAVTDARDEAYRAGCDAFLVKPCDPEVLWLQIVALLRVAGSLGRSLRRPMAT
jgi:DNA-binding response OmpR family regulator